MSWTAIVGWVVLSGLLGVGMCYALRIVNQVARDLKKDP